MLTSTNTIAAPLSTDWVDGESPLINPAGPDCGLRIQAVMIVAATPPMMIATICWSLNRFFIGSRARLARARSMPNDGDTLSTWKFDQGFGRCQAEDRAGGSAFDDKAAGTGAVRRRVGYRDPLHCVGDVEVGRDVTAGADANGAADRGRSPGDRQRGQRNLAALGVLDQRSGRRRRQGGRRGANVAVSYKRYRRLRRIARLESEIGI